MDYDNLQEQVKQEIQMWLEYVQPKRQKFREKLVKYIDQDKEDGRVGINIIYSMINLSIALSLSDENNVLFLPRKFGDEEYAENLTNLANYDYEEMDLKRKDYARYFDSRFFGVSIREKAWWNDRKKCVEIEQSDPLTWIPDPYGDYLRWFRFHYFEKEILKSSMTSELWFREELIEELTNDVDEETQNNKTYRNEVSWLNNVTDTSADFYVSVYDWYTYYEWDLYKITLSKAWEILRAEQIEAVREEEKTDKIDIKTQVVIEWYSPIRWNAFGISMVDIIEDKQTAISELMNMRLIDARFSTFGQMNLFNTDIVKNVQDLKKPSLKTKWIWVNAWGQNLANAVYPVPRQNIMQDSYNVTSELTRQIQLDTWISENTLWVAEKWLTLWQSQQVQSNANLRLSLWITVSNWGEEEFWDYIWLRSYEEYYDSSDKKIIRVSNGFGTNVIEVRKDEFFWGKHPEIKIDSKKKIEAQRDRQKQDFLATIWYILEDQSQASITKTIAKRHLFKLQWMSREMINILTYNPAEEKAKMMVHLLNENDFQWAEISDISEDHLTYMIVFESARDTPAKEFAIQQRRLAYIMSGQNINQNESPDGWMVRMAQSMNTANVMGKQPVSTQDVWQ